jgi:hypothetical protein
VFDVVLCWDGEGESSLLVLNDLGLGSLEIRGGATYGVGRCFPAAFYDSAGLGALTCLRDEKGG